MNIFCHYITYYILNVVILQLARDRQEVVEKIRASSTSTVYQVERDVVRNTVIQSAKLSEELSVNCIFISYFMKVIKSNNE